MSDHAWVQENLGTYFADGLTLEEHGRLTSHVASCAACTQALENARNLEQMMQGLFADVQPDAGLEDRVLKNLRHAPRPRSNQQKLLFRIAVGVAAVVMLGLVGVAMQALGLNGPLPLPGAKKDESRLASTYYHRTEGTTHHGLNFVADSSSTSTQSDEKREPFTTVDADPIPMDLGKDINYSVDRIAEMSVPSSFNPNEALGFKVKESTKKGLKGLTSGLTASGTLTPNIPDGQGEECPDGSAAPADSKARPTTKLQIINGTRQEMYGFEWAEKDGKSPPLPTEKAYNYGLSTTDADKTKTSPHPPKVVIADKTTPPSPPINHPQKPFNFYIGMDRDDGPQKKPESAPPEETVGQKIIRTGEMDFVVDKFDEASKVISKLIDNIKGSYIKEKSRDELANGKVRGSVIVRMPPQALNKFVDDLNRDLGKSAKLVTQKIGSQDVTKQYTDLEGRLKVARAMEQRWLDIIQKGKGEIKDLIAAEQALGTTRTKIEEMEGEIRYYNGQISLSTLTINLTEKEIQAPSALVVSESVRMRLEVDDVEKSFKETLAAVLAVQGRVTKSDVKQQAIGKLEGIVLAEVPHDKDAALRESLKKLGIIRHQDAERTQQTEGGSGPPLKLEARYKDVQFEIKLYNTANIQPRETITLQIATLDVPGSYRKLQEAVAQAKGQVLSGTVSEQDKLNTSAKLDFDLLTSEKQAIDKLIAEVGQIFTRSNTQIPATEVATDRQVGYRLTFRTVAGIPPRETIKLTVEVREVDKKASELTDLMRASKGIVVASKTQHDQNGQAGAALVFDVPLSAEDALVRQIKDAGIVRTQQSTRNSQVPENDLATARIELTLVGTTGILPDDEGLWPQIRTSLYYSFKMFSLMLMLVILGISVVLPWALVIWGVYRVGRRFWGKPQVVG